MEKEKEKGNGEEEEKVQTKENGKAPAEFSEKDETERSSLISKGFPNWGKKEFFLFIKLCEKFGRANYEKISEEMTHKNAEEVKLYSKAFWKKWELIENGERYVDRIEKGEAQLKQLNLIEEIVSK